MRVPVLAVMPSQEPLRESATAAVQKRPPTIPLSAARVPSILQLDTTFPAVPVAPAGRATLREAQADSAPDFAVRGFVETEKADDIPAVTPEGHKLFADPVIAPFLTCGGDPPVGGVAQVIAKLNLPAMAARGLDGKDVAVAIMDTGINLAHLRAKLGTTPGLDVANSWTPSGSTTLPGRHPVDHGTMCAFDALLAAPKATLLDFPILASSAPGGSTVGSTLSVAVQAYAQLIAFWSVAFAPGGAPRYKGLVVNNSWGIFHPSWDFPSGHPGRFIDNPNHPFCALVGVLARGGADIVFAAGNCGSTCADGRCQGRVTGTIMGSSAYQDVLTVAGCDTTDLRVGYSSQGPSIAGMFQNKPDITGYTHFLGSEAFGLGSPDSGTSAACPVVAGCVAAIRTKVAPGTLPPPNLFLQLMANARVPAGLAPGWNGDYGHGIIDPDSTALGLGV